MKQLNQQRRNYSFSVLYLSAVVFLACTGKTRAIPDNRQPAQAECTQYYAPDSIFSICLPETYSVTTENPVIIQSGEMKVVISAKTNRLEITDVINPVPPLGLEEDVAGKENLQFIEYPIRDLTTFAVEYEKTLKDEKWYFREIRVLCGDMLYLIDLSIPLACLEKEQEQLDELLHSFRPNNKMNSNNIKQIWQ